MACFHCGLENLHEISECPLLLQGVEQAQAGKDAKKEFNDARKRWRKQNGKCKKVKSKLHNYFVVREYLHHLTSNSAINEICKFEDPIELIKSNPKETCSPHRTQKAALDFLNYIITQFLQELIQVFEQTNNSVDYRNIVKTYRHKNENNPWSYVLNEAVRQGIPADFSDLEKNRYYAIQKLETRTRYLYLLIMDDNEICRKVRNLLSNRFKCSKNDNGCTKKRKQIHVTSIGGGPGYDHIAIWIAFLFIFNMNDGIIDTSNVTFRTEVYDLYGEWEDTVKAMSLSLTKTQEYISKENSSKFKMNLFDGNEAHLKLCDIREDLSSEANESLSKSLEFTDIICFSFVIHENASIILPDDDSDPFIQGTARDIMEQSKVGTIILCTDSSHRCWPSFITTAKYFGWKHLDSSERKSTIPLGPKSYAIFLRTDTIV